MYFQNQENPFLTYHKAKSWLFWILPEKHDFFTKFSAFDWSIPYKNFLGSQENVTKAEFQVPRGISLASTRLRNLDPKMWIFLVVFQPHIRIDKSTWLVSCPYHMVILNS